ncbi:hypothetical protein GCM10011511_06590 [Puia dinghuensis]|uniref:LamG domain-containing protein n=1 Tax=Puia dinghuensis TaxID=1792502 RepID=A0A8J2XQS6_9BACT|nr:hypothetical protein GCM10011511_06590 [Puia dinghuensis]
MVFFFGCTKNPGETPPVHDTVTVVKNDTIIKNDTIYGTKPDSTVNLTKGLLLYLPFTGNINDSSGNNNPTVAVGSVLTYDAHGYANSAFGSNGSQKIYVTNNGSIKFDTAWAISLGFMVNDSRPETYISMVDPATGYGPSFNFGNTLATLPYLACGSGDITLGCNNYGPVNNYNITDSTNFIPVAGSWYNGIVIYHKGTLQTYINGTLISTKVGAGTQAELCPASKVIIGAWWDGGPQGLNGKLDNIRLYNRVLTPHEIAVLSSSYQVTSNSLRPGLRSH